jgi:23S rRNA pseudouridine1911/1915/1917 synthase
VPLRLDKFLAASDRLASRGRVVDALERGKVFVNERPADRTAAGMRLSPGDVVRVWMDRPGSSRRLPGSGVPAIQGLNVLYEDRRLIVLNKPAGLLTVPLPRRSDAVSAMDLLKTYLRPQRTPRPLVVHRIDRDTSGIVVFAKDAQAQGALKAQFRRREPERVYLAIVYGHPEPGEGTWRDHLVWDQKFLIQRRTRAADPQGKEAVCRYRVRETFTDASLIEIRLETGKRNQIRLQARLRGHTLVGEQRYVIGQSPARPIPFGRQALHAWRLSFAHPEDDRPLGFEAPLPPDLEQLLTALRRRSRR